MSKLKSKPTKETFSPADLGAEIEDEPKPVKTSKEIVSEGLIKRTQFSKEELAEVHRKNARRDYSYLTLIEVRNRYGQRKDSILLLAELYNIPVVSLSDDASALISQPCLDHVLSTAPELLNNTIGNSLASQQRIIRAEVEAEFRAKCQRELEDKLKTL